MRSLRTQGFTLVEVLVALAIVSIALLAALRASAVGTTGTADLRTRTLAGWVAQDLLAEHRALEDWLPVGSRRGHARQGGLEFNWREDVTATQHAAFRRVDVLVFAPDDGGHVAARLSGFLVRAGEP